MMVKGEEQKSRCQRARRTELQVASIAVQVHC